MPAVHAHAGRSSRPRCAPPVKAFFGHKKNKEEGHKEDELKGEKLSITNVTSALLHAQRAWNQYDTDKSGTLSLHEALNLLNRWGSHVRLTPLPPSHTHHHPHARVRTHTPCSLHLDEPTVSTSYTSHVHSNQ